MTVAVEAKTGVLEIKGLHAQIEGKEILKGLDLDVSQGKVHALMGPNGSGKSTLAYTLMGHPRYEVTAGEVLFGGEDILGLAPDERAKLGLFLSFQYPTAIPGVTMHNFLRTATKAVRGDELPPREFRNLVREQMELLKMDPSFATRYVNDGFSGGEKKRAEILQMGVLRPKIAILDETDSGLDIDALRTVAEGVEALRGPDLGVLLITHYQRILNYIKPDFVHVMYRGRIIRSGDAGLAQEIEARGYDWIIGDIPGEDEPADSGRELSPGERAFAEQHQAESARENS
ncbi:MAG: Fe-S cluster assembly ATPase SufC [Candidatus Dormibacteria bacterium]